MRFKGRYINDRKVRNVCGERIVEYPYGSGIIELRKEIDAICMEPDRTRPVPSDPKHNIKIYVSLIIASVIAVASVFGLFYAYACGITFIASLLWIAFVFWVNRI